MAELSGKTLGQYQLIEHIATGGMAHIYRAHQPSMKRDVAIKVMSSVLQENESFVARFIREVEIIAQLQHPHIVPVYDFGKEDGRLYVAMAYLSGHSLSDRLEYAPRGLPPKEVIRVIGLISQGLDYAHSKGIVHRDLKPSNILFDERNNPYIVDFGLAKALSDGQIEMTNSMMAGTPGYMAPEMAIGDNVTNRTDIYALGVILYKMLSGKLPYEATNPFNVVSLHVSAPIPKIREVNPDIPESVQLVIDKAMAKLPEDRYATADEMASSLRSAFDAEHITPTLPQQPVIKTVKKQIGNKIPLLASGGLVLALLAFAVILGVFKKDAPQTSQYTTHTPRPVPGSTDSWTFGCLENDKGYLTDLNCERIEIALENRYLPFNYIELNKDDPNGFDYDLWREICTQLHCEPVFIEHKWDDLLASVVAKKFDVASGGVTITSERQREMSFSLSYMNIDQRMIAKKDETRFANMDEFVAEDGLIMGVQAGSTNEAVALEYLPAERVKSYKEYSAMLYSLTIGEVDAAIVDQYIGQNFISGVVPTDSSELEMIGSSLSSDQLGLAFQKDSPLADPVDRALGQLRVSGILDALMDHYFGDSFAVTYDDIQLGAYSE